MTTSSTEPPALQPLLARRRRRPAGADPGVVGSRRRHGRRADRRRLPRRRAPHPRARADAATAAAPEWISVAPHGASRVVFGGLLRAVDDHSPDPKVRILRDRVVEDGVVARDHDDQLSRRPPRRRPTLRVRIVPDFAPLQEVKAGTADRTRLAASRRSATPGRSTVELRRAVVHDHRGRGRALRRRRRGHRRSGGSMSHRARPSHASWSIAPGRSLARRPRRAARRPRGPFRPLERRPAAHAVAGCRARRPRRAAARSARPPRRRVLRRRCAVVPDALRPGLAVGGAARPPGRSPHRGIHSSRPRAVPGRRAPTRTPRSSRARSCTSCAASRSRCRARASCCRRCTTAPSTRPPLWVCLLADAWRAGMPEDEVRELLPALRAALDWLAAPRRQRRRRVHRLHRRDRTRAREPGVEGLGRLDPVALGRPRRRPDRAVRSAGLRVRGRARRRRPARPLRRAGQRRACANGRRRSRPASRSRTG